MDRRAFIKIAGSASGATNVPSCFLRCNISEAVPLLRYPVSCRFLGNKAAERRNL